ncbi:MAG TPA: hypothetical protein PL074_03220 [Thermoflexales bacterium]|nr:hypothetical protein [Thermoflexales bacterium]
MKPVKPVGIVGYGAYVPRYRLPAHAVSELWTHGNAQPPVREKSVPGLDEDVATMSIEAARNAINLIMFGRLARCGWAANLTPTR